MSPSLSDYVSGMGADGSVKGYTAMCIGYTSVSSGDTITTSKTSGPNPVGVNYRHFLVYKQ